MKEWDRFTTTGKIDDYLLYAGAKRNLQREDVNLVNRESAVNRLVTDELTDRIPKEKDGSTGAGQDMRKGNYFKTGSGSGI